MGCGASTDAGLSRTEIVFTNQTNQVVTMFCINDADGKELNCGNIPPYASQTQPTYVGVKWVIKAANGEVLARVAGSTEKIHKDIERSQPPAPKPNVSGYAAGGSNGGYGAPAPAVAGGGGYAAAFPQQGANKGYGQGTVAGQTPAAAAQNSQTQNGGGGGSSSGGGGGGYGYAAAAGGVAVAGGVGAAALSGQLDGQFKAADMAAAGGIVGTGLSQAEGYAGQAVNAAGDYANNVAGAAQPYAAAGAAAAGEYAGQAAAAGSEAANAAGEYAGAAAGYANNVAGAAGNLAEAAQPYAAAAGDAAGGFVANQAGALAGSAEAQAAAGYAGAAGGFVANQAGALAGSAEAQAAAGYAGAAGGFLANQAGALAGSAEAQAAAGAVSGAVDAAKGLDMGDVQNAVAGAAPLVQGALGAAAFEGASALAGVQELTENAGGFMSGLMESITTVVCSDGFADGLNTGLGAALAVGISIPVLGQVFALLGDLKSHAEQYAKQELECTRLSVWCTSMMGVLGRLSKSAMLNEETEDLLNKTSEALKDLSTLVMGRHEKKGMMGAISKFWGGAAYQRKSDHAHLVLDQLVRALQLGLTADTKGQVDVLMKRSEVLLKMDVQLQRIDAKLDYIGGAIDKQSAEMKAMHQELLAALHEGGGAQNSRGPADVISDEAASGFWKTFGLPEQVDWRMLKASLKRWDRSLTEDEVEYIRGEMDLNQDRLISNVEFNIFCQPSFHDRLAEIRRGQTGSLFKSLQGGLAAQTLAEKLGSLDVPLKDGMDYHVFLTHDWGQDEADRNNHLRVARVNSYLKERGLSCWFDEDCLEGDIEEAMCAGIDSSSVVIVFITDRYAKKVTGKEEGDFCKKEFKYACMRKKPFVPVVMEERMRDATSWPGTIGMNLGSKKYESLVEDEDFDQKCEALLQNVLKQLG